MKALGGILDDLSKMQSKLKKKYKDRGLKGFKLGVGELGFEPYGSAPENESL